MVVNSALVTALLMSGLAAAGAGAVAVGAAALAAVFAFGAAFGAAVAALSAAFGLVAGGVALPSAGGVVVAAADEPVALAGCSLPVTAPLGAVVTRIHCSCRVLQVRSVRLVRSVIQASV